jgi:hypothetical protein
MKVKLHRSEQIVRGEESTVTIRFEPTEKFKKLPPDEKKNVVAFFQKYLKAQELHVHSETGEIDFVGGGDFTDWGTVQIETDSDWQYDGGEVTTLSTRYDRTVELVKFEK